MRLFDPNIQPNDIRPKRPYGVRTSANRFP
jgi:hypothetical protein